MRCLIRHRKRRPIRIVFQHEAFSGTVDVFPTLSMPFDFAVQMEPIPLDVQRASKERTSVDKDALGSRAHDMVELVKLLAVFVDINRPGACVSKASRSMARAEKWQAACSFLGHTKFDERS